MTATDGVTTALGLRRCAPAANLGAFERVLAVGALVHVTGQELRGDVL